MILSFLRQLLVSLNRFTDFNLRFCHLNQLLSYSFHANRQSEPMKIQRLSQKLIHRIENQDSSSKANKNPTASPSKMTSKRQQTPSIRCRGPNRTKISVLCPVLSCSRLFCPVLSRRTRQGEIWLFWEIFLKHPRCYTCCLLVTLQKYYYKYKRKNAVLLCTSNNSKSSLTFRKNPAGKDRVSCPVLLET